LDEFEIIRRYFTPEEKSDSVIVGVGDDGAVLRPEQGRDLINVVDSLVSGVHFPENLRPEDVGYRAVAVNVSDIAAMGGIPRWMTLALTLDKDYRGWVEDFACGIALAADTYGIDLVGGDLTHGSETVISVQITGDVEPDLAITRSGAKPGDAIYVSGTPGDASLGLSIIQSNPILDDQLNTLIRRFCRPDARVELGQAIAPHASAAIDVSDGLFSDLEKMLAASGVSGCIELNDIHLSIELTNTLAEEDRLKFVLGGGDDYELCFTAADEGLFESGEIAGVCVTKIGQVGTGSGLSCTKGGDPFEYQDDGYRHFS
jgi:thiamine-monophosphate kinase